MVLLVSLKRFTHDCFYSIFITIFITVIDKNLVSFNSTVIILAINNSRIGLPSVHLFFCFVLLVLFIYFFFFENACLRFQTCTK